MTNLCNQNCTNTYGSYICSCYDGFRLLANSQTCDGACIYVGTKKNPMHAPQAPWYKAESIAIQKEGEISYGCSNWTWLWLWAYVEFTVANSIVAISMHYCLVFHSPISFLSLHVSMMSCRYQRVSWRDRHLPTTLHQHCGILHLQLWWWLYCH